MTDAEILERLDAQLGPDPYVTSDPGVFRGFAVAFTLGAAFWALLILAVRA